MRRRLATWSSRNFSNDSKAAPSNGTELRKRLRASLSGGHPKKTSGRKKSSPAHETKFSQPSAGWPNAGAATIR